MKPDFSVEALQGGLMSIEHRDPVFRFKLRMVADDKPVEQCWRSAHGWSEQIRGGGRDQENTWLLERK